MKCKTCKKLEVEDVKFFHCESCRAKRKERIEGKKALDSLYEIVCRCTKCNAKLTRTNDSHLCYKCKPVYVTVNNGTVNTYESHGKLRYNMILKF